MQNKDIIYGLTKIAEAYWMVMAEIERRGTRAPEQREMALAMHKGHLAISAMMLQHLLGELFNQNP